MAAQRSSQSVYGCPAPPATVASSSARPTSYPSAPRLRTVPLPLDTHPAVVNTHFLLAGGAMTYNVTLPPSTAQIVSRRGHGGISAEILNLPATSPSWRHATVQFYNCPREWDVTIARPSGVTVGDVLAAVWQALATEEFLEIPTAYGVQRQRVARIHRLRGARHLHSVVASIDGRLIVRLH